jgi:hypothetical protein
MLKPGVQVPACCTASIDKGLVLPNISAIGDTKPGAWRNLK